MTNLPRITTAFIRATVAEQSCDRGVDYYHARTVESATLRGNKLFASVHGSEWDPYQVRVTFADSNFTASCTCPYDWDGYCKHVVAVLLTVCDDDPPIPIAAKPPVADLAEGLDAPALRAMIQRLVETCPALMDTVDEFCSVKSI